MNERCILLLGGSFDPVHEGHLALARYFGTLLHPDELRLVPAGQPWQKPEMMTPAADRVAMLRLAFAEWSLPVVIDEQEISRTGPSYTIDTLRSLRTQLGDKTSLALALGADQLLNLHTWRDWSELFELAHLCFAARPGFDIRSAAIHPEVNAQLTRRMASPPQLRQTPHGLTFVATNLKVDVSSTAIRQALRRGDPKSAENVLAGYLPRAVLDYIRHHHLYQTP